MNEKVFTGPSLSLHGLQEKLRGLKTERVDRTLEYHHGKHSDGELEDIREDIHQLSVEICALNVEVEIAKIQVKRLKNSVIEPNLVWENLT
jgi:hypothetical protein